MMTGRRARSVGAALLLLSTTGIGIAWAASDIHPFGLTGHERHHDRAEAPAMQLAESGGGHERGEQGDHGRHDEDDDDDDEGGPSGRAVLPPTGPADPRAPVPDNGLFNGKARPQVEVK